MLQNVVIVFVESLPLVVLHLLQLSFRMHRFRMPNNATHTTSTCYISIIYVKHGLEYMYILHGLAIVYNALHIDVQASLILFFQSVGMQFCFDYGSGGGGGR